VPPSISANQRAELEFIVVKALATLDGELKGDYYPLAGSNTYAPKPNGIDKETFRKGVPMLSVEDDLFVDRVFEVLDEDPQGNTDPWLKLEHRPSGACINFCGNSNGWLECLRRSGSEWETAWTAGPIETDESVVGSINDDAGHPLHDFQLLRKLSTWCEEPNGDDGSWRFSLRPGGVLVSPTGAVHVDAGGVVESNLLNAQGGMIHMRTRVGVGADFIEPDGALRVD